MDTAPRVVYEFGPFRVDPGRATLLRDGEPLPITPKVFEVLLTLVQRRDEVVAKEELLRTVWAGRVVEEANLSQCIYMLRKLLGEGHNQRHYVQTVARSGYQFVAPVRTVALDLSAAPSVSGATNAPDALDAPNAPEAAPVPDAPELPDAPIAPDVPDAPSAPVALATPDVRDALGVSRPPDVPNALDAADASADIPEDPPAADPPLPLATPAPTRRPRSHRWAWTAVGVLIAAVLAVGTGWFMHRSPPTAVTAARPDPQPAAAPKPFNPPADSLAVLPLIDLSGNPKQQYLSDGITEDLTDTLGHNPALQVTAWATASRYRSAAPDVARIGRQLNVAHLLNGSIQRMGDELRVTVELVDTCSGRQVWSQHYDGGLADIFKVQDRISEAIASALNVQFTRLGPAREVNPQAYDLVLRARALAVKARTAAAFEQLRGMLEKAVALDPDYADAHAALAGTWMVLTEVSTLPLKAALPKIRTEANRALTLDPRNVTALLVLALADQAVHDIAGARAKFQRALAIDPSSSAAHLNYGTMLPLKQARAQFAEAVRLNPDAATAQNDLAAAELDLGEYQQALAPNQALVRLDPTSADSVFNLAFNYSVLHRNVDAVKAFDLARPNTELGKALVAAGRLTYQSVLDPKLDTKALAAVAALRSRSDLDPDAMGDVQQLELALGQNAIALQQLQKYCAAQPVACSDLSLNPQYGSLRGDPRFRALVKQYDTMSK